eukprot:COSAG02_NODE_1056_length_14925_cov_84.064212_4_plen_169_part_00
MHARAAGARGRRAHACKGGMHGARPVWWQVLRDQVAIMQRTPPDDPPPGGTEPEPAAVVAVAPRDVYWGGTEFSPVQPLLPPNTYPSCEPPTAAKRSWSASIASKLLKLFLPSSNGATGRHRPADWRHRPADWRHRPAPIGATAQRRLAPPPSLAPRGQLGAVCGGFR